MKLSWTSSWMPPWWPALVLVGLLPGLMGFEVLRSRNPAVEAGNLRMQAGKAEEALVEYDKALAKLPNDPQVHFNRGAALYGLSRFEEAAESFLRATEGRTTQTKAAAFYNLGNSFFQTKRFGDAVESFKKSLLYDPKNLKAKRNLELALRSKRQEDEQKKQDPKQDKQDQKQDAKNDGKGPEEPDPQSQNESGKDPGGQNPKEDPKQDPKDDPKPDQAPKDQQAKDQPAKDEPPAQDQPPKDDQPGEKSAANEAAQDKADPAAAKEEPGNGKKAEGLSATAQETEAILDSLERSPKALEQQLARIRAMNRRQPVKDW